MLSYMPLSAPKPLEFLGMSITPLFTLFNALSPPYVSFYYFGAHNWTNILNLKVLAFQNAIIHASIWSKPSRILRDVKHPHFCSFLRRFPPLYAPFYCFGGLDWTNILKLKVLAFQNAIIHASICSRTLWD